MERKREKKKWGEEGGRDDYSPIQNYCNRRDAGPLVPTVLLQVKLKGARKEGAEGVLSLV